MTEIITLPQFKAALVVALSNQPFEQQWQQHRVAEGNATIEKQCCCWDKEEPPAFLLYARLEPQIATVDRSILECDHNSEKQGNLEMLRGPSVRLNSFLLFIKFLWQTKLFEHFRTALQRQIERSFEYCRKLIMEKQPGKYCQCHDDQWHANRRRSSSK